LQVGSTLQVWDTNRSQATLVCDGEPLYRCGIGQKEGHFAISIDGKIDQWNEFVDEIAVDDERAAPGSLRD
jgi:flagellar motor switch protein FliM